MTTPSITFFHSPQTRSGGVLALLEELAAPYELRLLDNRAGEQRRPDYLAVNPMGKVPAILDGDALVTEQVAVYLYLADRFNDAGLAPPIGDPLRGPYLRWIAFYGSSFEPALVDHALKREPGPPSTLPYGDYETTVKTLNDHLARGDYILGDRFSAADVLWGTALQWTTSFGIIEKTPVVAAYIERITARPALKRAREKDEAWAAEQEKKRATRS